MVGGTCGPRGGVRPLTRVLVTACGERGPQPKAGFPGLPFPGPLTAPSAPVVRGQPLAHFPTLLFSASFVLTVVC